MNTAHTLKRFFTTYCVAIFSLLLLLAVMIAALFPYFYRPTDTLCGCSAVAAMPNTPASWILFGLLLIGILGLTILLGRVVHMLWQTWQFHRVIAHQRTHTTVYRGIAIHTVSLPTIKAVCMGYLRPQIYISSTLIQQLSGFELLAVIQHEAEHAK